MREWLTKKSKEIGGLKQTTLSFNPQAQLVVKAASPPIQQEKKRAPRAVILDDLHPDIVSTSIPLPDLSGIQGCNLFQPINFAEPSQRHLLADEVVQLASVHNFFTLYSEDFLDLQDFSLSYRLLYIHT